ncbi:hypothetical protein [Deinococcus hopiensis]|uniref:Alpha/beta hydrolase family protein n=1 Tax=Deinococcus hopiensis KR-140 TaxID=695939 RepID=A0A1W1VBF3_9DEIO|nr:hypothetical protein [Deinococcus hopiensis]SMB90381.1 hypothetical protein SAMN00790413_00748 [Deinococcus hopiensis KR-140]
MKPALFPPLLLTALLAAGSPASAQDVPPAPAPPSSVQPSPTSPPQDAAPQPPATPAIPASPQDAPTAPPLLPELPEALRFAHPLGEAFLFLPAACAPSCSLVVVSHSRGMTADLSLTRPHLRAIYARLLGAGFAVLVSNDAGPTTWGAPQALTYLAEMRARAIQSFAFSGRTYNFGYSMGGLPALLTAYLPVYPVSGVMLLDAEVNLTDVWTGPNATFRADMSAAYDLPSGAPLPRARDPYNDFATPEAARLPILVVGSAEDRVVPFARNGEALFARTTSPQSRIVRLTGPHLGGTHFGPALVDEMLAFLAGLEPARKAVPETPAAPVTPGPSPAAPGPATPGPPGEEGR